jgi:hypothetical protein
MEGCICPAACFTSKTILDVFIWPSFWSGISVIGIRVKLDIKYFSGFEIGCVSSERYHKMCKMERNIADGIEFLKSIVKPANHWRQLLHMPAAKGTLLKR